MLLWSYFVAGTNSFAGRGHLRRRRVFAANSNVAVKTNLAAIQQFRLFRWFRRKLFARLHFDDTRRRNTRSLSQRVERRTCEQLVAGVFAFKVQIELRSRRHWPQKILCAIRSLPRRNLYDWLVPVQRAARQLRRRRQLQTRR